MEPNYVGSNGRIDAMAAAWLLDNDHVFFLDNEITWNGKNHGFTGAQMNIAAADEAPIFTANYQTLMSGVIDLMTTLEQDDGLRVPRGMVHESLHEAIREGDLTGITLFNLIACGHAIKIIQNDENAYQIIYDNRLARGIPSFYALASRMVWDMRAYNDVQQPFQIAFASARNFDADQYLRNFNDMVPGAVSESFHSKTIDTLPTVNLPAEQEVAAYVEEQSRQFASGFDAPDEMQADEELFETALTEIAKGFPRSIDIEGTHVFGRIPRIENVKVGDLLVLASDWQNDYFDPVCIEVFNAEGETLGNLSNRFFSIANSNYREFACLLPYLTATVQSVTPLSTRRKGSKYALMDVRLEIDSSIFDDGLWDPPLSKSVVAEAKKLLALPRAKRVLLSKGNLVASDLKGCVATEQAEDEPNPLGSTYRPLGTESEDSAQTIGNVAEGNEDAAENPLDTLQSLLTALNNLKEALGDEGGTDAGAEQDEPASEIGEWTFEQGKTAKGRRFSITLPDQFALVDNCDGRPMAVPVGDFQEGDEPDYLECSQIIYSDMLGDLDEDTKATWHSNFIPEARIQMIRRIRYEAEGFMGGGAIDDWMVEGRNCPVLVIDMQLASFFGAPPAHEYYVAPIVYDHNDQLRITDSYGKLAPGQLKELAEAVAKTVEVDKPIQLELMKRLAQHKEELTEFAEFSETVKRISNILNVSAGWHLSADFYRDKHRINDDQEFAKSYASSIANAFSDSLEDQVDYYEKFIEILKAQKELGNPEYPALWQCVEEAASQTIVDHIEHDGEDEILDAANATGLITIPERFESLHKEWEALAPDKTTNADASASIQPEVETESAPKRTISETVTTAAIPRIEKALNEPITGAYYVETSEIAANELMAARQKACDNATSAIASDEDNVTAMAAEFDKFNAVICRYLGYFVDVIEAQAKLGVDKREIEMMAVEAGEFSELVANRFSCGNSYLDKIANSRHPIKRPVVFAELQSRLRKVMFG